MLISRMHCLLWWYRCDKARRVPQAGAEVLQARKVTGAKASGGE